MVEWQLRLPISMAQYASQAKYEGVMEHSYNDIRFHHISNYLNENMLSSKAVRGIRALLRTVLLKQDHEEARKTIQAYKSLLEFIHPIKMMLSSDSSQQEIDRVIDLAKTHYVSLIIIEVNNDNCLLIKNLLEF